MCVYDLRDITEATSTDAICPAVQATQQQINLALNKVAWTVNNDTKYPPSWAVDNDDETLAFIAISSAWPFLAVDLGGPVMVESVQMNFGHGECQVW